MKTLLALSAALFTSIILTSANADEPAKNGQPAVANRPAELKTLRDKASYGIGLSIGRNIKQQGFDLDISHLAAGVADSLKGGKPRLSDGELQEVMQEFEKEHTANQAARAKVTAETNQKEGDAFLAENKKKGVKTTKSGLQYQVLKQGKGKTPAKEDTVTTHYVGTLLDGSEFDSSVKRGQPATFPVSGVIPGWTEALQLMPVGSKWRLFVPAELAYGARGAGPDIGPNATLVFDVELLDIGKPEDAGPPQEALEQ